MFKAVVFDMNGVIVDDERIHQESWRQLCQKYGFHLTEDDFKHKVFGRTEADTFTYLFHKQLSRIELQQYSSERVKIAISIFKPKLALTEGLLQFLQELQAKNIPLAIATSARKPYTDFILDGLNVREFFKQIVTAEEISKGKPDPEIYLLAAKRISIDPKDCVAFEDSLSGIKSAQAAGMKVVGITTTHTVKELDIANKIIKSFKNITVEELVVL
ncbi:MAG: HAD family phosphatase [Patescibacteria group bacterium]